MIKTLYQFQRMMLHALSFVCFTTVCTSAVVAQEKKPIISTITIKGNVFEISSGADTFEILNPETGEVKTVIENPDPIPIKVNGMNIYDKGDGIDKESSVTGDMLRRYVLERVGNTIAAKGDGMYRLKLNNAIVSDKGKIVYYNFSGVEKNSKPVHRGDTKAEWNLLGEDLTKNISKQLDRLIDKAPVYKPATVYKNPVPFRLDDKETEQIFYIKNGVVSYAN